MRRDGKMIKYNTQAKRELTLEELSNNFAKSYNELVNEYYIRGKVVTLTDYYVYISEDGQKAKMLRFNSIDYKNFLKKGLASVHLTKKNRNVFLGVYFNHTEDGEKFDIGARDLIGFSSSY